MIKNYFNSMSAKRKRQLGTVLTVAAFAAFAGYLTYGKLTTNSDFVPYTGELRNDVRHYRTMLEDPRNREIYDNLIQDNKCYILKRPHEEACRYYQKRGMNWPAHAKVGV